MPAGVKTMTTPDILTGRDRRDVLKALDAAGHMWRTCPLDHHIEIFADSPTEPGFRRWVEVPMNRQAIADVVAPLRVQTKTPEGWWTMPHRFSVESDRLAFLERIRAENPGRQFRAI
jgi:hypothetical protein